MRRLLKSQSGQGMSEYLIIVALIAMGTLGVVTVFGRDIRELFSATTNSLTGGQATNRSVTAKVNTRKDIKSFGKYDPATGDK